MAEGTPVIDPAVVELLRDFEETAPGGLRGAESKAFAKAILGRSRLPRPASALLRALEGSFDPAMRWETSRLIHNVGLAMLQQSDESAGRIRYNTDSGPAPGSPEVRGFQSEELGEALASREWVASRFGADATLITEAIAGNLAPTADTAAELARRALILAPNDPASNTLAIACSVLGKPKSALCILGGLRKKTHYAELRMAITENMGLAFSISGDHRRAVLAYGSVAREDSARVNAACCWLMNALQCEDLETAARAAALLDDSPTNSHVAIQGVAEMLKATRLAGKWAALPNAFNSLRVIQHDLGPISEQVTNALH